MACIPELLELEKHRKSDTVLYASPDPNHEENSSYAGFLYHTTPYPILKKILQDGFIDQSVKHPGFVCWTIHPFLHLSSVPNLAIVAGLSSNDTYLRIPFDYAVAYGARPVLYEVHKDYDGRLQLEIAGFRLVSNEDAITSHHPYTRGYLYHTWMIECEWRIPTFSVPVVTPLEIFCSAHQQVTHLKQLTKLPVHVDKNLHQYFSALRLDCRVREKIYRALGHFYHGTSEERPIHYVEIRAKENKFCLYNVKADILDELYNRLTSQGYRLLGDIRRFRKLRNSRIAWKYFDMWWGCP